MTTKTTKSNKPANKASELKVRTTPGVTPERQLADLVTAGDASNAWLMANYSAGTFGEVSLSDCVLSLRKTTSAVKGGDLTSAETLLTAQALALNSIFGELARRSALNMGEYMNASERYMRLALKAQGQCRATLETLAAIKNPPVVFARQANINNGGQQQVNNGTVPQSAGDSPPRRCSQMSTPAGIPEKSNSELLEVSDGQRLDPGASGAAGGADPHLATVGAGNRTTHR